MVYGVFVYLGTCGVCVGGGEAGCVWRKIVDLSLERETFRFIFTTIFSWHLKKEFFLEIWTF